MRITALVDNRKLEGREDLLPEHGLSLHIRIGGLQLLFDTGVSDAFARNARGLGMEIGEVDAAVVSHHHYDHGGGLARFLEANSGAKVYLRRWEGRECWFRGLLFLRRYVGLDRGLFERHPDRFEFVGGDSEIMPGIHVMTGIDLPHPVPAGNRKLYEVEGGVWRRDPFEHELILVVEEEGSLVVFSGCSHRGILNIMEAVVGRFPGRPVKAVFGGFHLIATPVLNTMAGSRRQMEELGRRLARYPVKTYHTGHCTGLKAYRILKGTMGERIEYLCTGGCVEV